MTLYQLKATQALSVSKEEAWSFLSDPGNLQKITPDSMGFKILGGADQQMYPGQIIHYSVTPLAGIKMRWVTEITHVVEGSYFVDEQRFGPYSLWHHKHFIKPVEGGILMEDRIDYKLPLGRIGALLGGPMVRKQLKKIFNYRERVLAEKFGQIPSIATSLTIQKI